MTAHIWRTWKRPPEALCGFPYDGRPLRHRPVGDRCERCEELAPSWFKRAGYARLDQEAK